MAISLSNREADLMQVLWDHGPSTVAEVRERIKVDLAYTTVLTILRNLHEKGHVGFTAEGRAHRYFAKVKAEQARKSALRHLAGKLFKGSAELLLTQLVSERKLSEDQLRRIRAILAEKPGRS